MSAFILTAAMLLAGAPADADGGPPAPPVVATVPPANVDNIGAPENSATPAGPATPTVPAPPTVPKPPAPGPDTRQGDIVVTARGQTPPGDPLQAANAKSFQVTQAVDRAVVGPVALAYEQAMPKPVRNGLRNFLGNLHEPVVFLSFLLQLKPGKAAETVGRFAINSTLGGGGVFDVAKRHPFNLPRRANGIADTLGYYGVEPGPFLFLPLIGPTTLRDLIGNGIDRLVLPLSVGGPFKRLAYTLPVGVLSALDRRANFDEQLHKIRDDSADPYVAARRFYLERRQAEIDGLRAKHSDFYCSADGAVQPDMAAPNLPLPLGSASLPDNHLNCAHTRHHALGD
jgi:phospholipid-binding lipoprotein MlaA